LGNSLLAGIGTQPLTLGDVESFERRVQQRLKLLEQIWVEMSYATSVPDRALALQLDPALTAVQARLTAQMQRLG
jgi:hypothetical protein